ncbi:PcfJ domain-containing protein [Defluviimonas salinarum]|uniref:PcfJ domain-containing protein n=1 Tax=Defluviimonas salinarum TaxID=2992147 RepID=A0ABT3J5K7_9RHOB|nr:PcfJ domain-containing protein [Defluviimonas salinarum]MCW3782976.1 PcfJ domain-containing protein [Defluviimonas salinarum]
MRVLNEFRPRDGGADIFLAGDGKDPSWMMLRWSEADQRLSGYLGGPSGDGLPTVRPVIMGGALVRPDTVGSVGLWSFLAASNLRAAIEGAKVRAGLSSQVNAWEAFLSGGPGDASAGRADDDPEVILLGRDQAGWMIANRLVKDRGGDLTPIRNPALRVGMPVSGFESARIRAAVSSVFKAIPKTAPGDIEAARTALAAVERPSARAVHWYASATGEAARDRMQAAASFPVLAGMIADNPILARAVDSREPLQPLIIERTGLGKGALKRLSQLKVGLPVGRLFNEGEEARGEDALGVNRLRRFTVSGEVSLDLALKHLSDLPPDRVPQDDRSWRIFHDILAGCAIPLENGLGVPVAKTLSACKGDWVAFHAALAKAADFEPAAYDRRAIALTTIDAMEAVEDFSRTAVIPLALSSIESTAEEIPEVSNEFFAAATGVASRVFLGEAKNVAAGVMELARRYASRIPALNAATGYAVDDGAALTGRFERYGVESFPRLADNFHASNGCVVRPLMNFGLMRLESERLNHCVGRLYLSKAFQANCHIFSVQSPDGKESYSTIELSAIRGETETEARQNFTVVQHRSKGNGDPSADAAAACAEWLGTIRNGAAWINFEELTAWREHVRAQGLGKEKNHAHVVTWKGVIGMEWREPERRQAAWEEWRYIIGGSFGKSPSVEVLFRDKGARDLVAAMSPKAAAILMERARQPRPALEEAAEPEPAAPAP